MMAFHHFTTGFHRIKENFYTARIEQKKVRRLGLGKSNCKESPRPNKTLKQTFPPLAGMLFSFALDFFSFNYRYANDHQL